MRKPLMALPNDNRVIIAIGAGLVIIAAVVLLGAIAFVALSG